MPNNDKKISSKPRPNSTTGSRYPSGVNNKRSNASDEFKPNQSNEKDIPRMRTKSLRGVDTNVKSPSDIVRGKKMTIHPNAENIKQKKSKEVKDKIQAAYQRIVGGNRAQSNR